MGVVRVMPGSRVVVMVVVKLGVVVNALEVGVWVTTELEESEST